MSKYIVVYDSPVDDGDSPYEVTHQGFDSELDLVNWLLRWSSVLSILSVSKASEFDEELF